MRLFKISILLLFSFDLQKAYDTTWKHGIQQDLHDMGLRGNLPIFIGNFLADKTFQIHLGTILSDVFIRKKVFHRALSCQPLYSMLKSMIL